jgi:predicted nuclease of predicted toxin-antitoxin system
MRFKIDENLPIEVADILQKAGHDAETVFSEKLSGEDDERIAAICQKEDRAIVTLDLGFADLRTYLPEDYAGLIVLRLAKQDKLFVLDIIQKLLPTLNQQNPEGKLWIVEENRIRVRG